MDEKVRRAGYELPWHPLQVASWVVFGINVTGFTLYCLPLVASTRVMYAVGVLFYGKSYFASSFMSISLANSVLYESVVLLGPGTILYDQFRSSHL